MLTITGVRIDSKDARVRTRVASRRQSEQRCASTLVGADFDDHSWLRVREGCPERRGASLVEPSWNLADPRPGLVESRQSSERPVAKQDTACRVHSGVASGQ